MKKTLAILLALVMALTLTACGGGNNDKSGNNDASGSSDGVDMSKYPSDINDWTGQNFIDYFTETGACTGGAGFETWMQPHEMYWDDSPVSECVGWWDDVGVSVIITILKPDLADSSQEQYDEWMAGFRENHAFPEEDYGGMPVDHMIGNVVFEYETSILDDDIYEKMTTAYEDLVSALGVTPDF